MAVARVAVVSGQMVGWLRGRLMWDLGQVDGRVAD